MLLVDTRYYERGNNWRMVTENGFLMKPSQLASRFTRVN